MTELAVRGARKSFGTLEVLDGVDLTVPAGSFTAILGASGSGKTTLLRIIAGFERLDGGTVVLGTEPVDDGRHTFVPSEHRHIGYVPQEGALFPHLSVGRNVGFGLPRGPNRRARVLELLDMVGLSGLHRRYPHQLSGGQQQRVALARALATDPEIVLLDEPFASLDASLRASVRSEVHDVLHRAGTTSILVTHDQDEALSMADQVAVLRDGVIAQLDTPAGIYQRPLDPGLAQFLGESNVLHVRVERPAGERAAIAATPFGALAVEGWPSKAAPGPAQVLIRPEQLVIGEAARSALVATVESYEYYGHDAVVRVHPQSDELPDLIVRVTGGTPLVTGARVGLSVAGSVVAWPHEAAHRDRVGPRGPRA
ncbi:MAG TPA: ABC transporter ATP-binding protein [Acidimicrobiales bacterium]|jgi:iron(III) transport system ATP-binding protein|nr:ABC transporter ATP-binding protein [Acidimicrobiales bacterium]